MRPKAIDVKALKDYELEIIFSNGERKIFDVKPYFKFKIFKELEKDEKNLKKSKYQDYQFNGRTVQIYAQMNYI